MEIPIEGVKSYRSRHGKWYVYHRKTGCRVTAKPGSPEFFAELARLDAVVEASVPKALPGTLGLLIRDYKRSPEYTELAPRTREDYAKVFDYLRPLDGQTLVAMNPGFIVEVRDAAFKKRKRHFANYVVAVLRLLFAWARVRGLVDDNPVARVPKFRRPKGAPKANRRWSRDELAIVLEAAPIELRLAIALAVCTGMRQGDVLRFPWSGYEGGQIQARAAKTGVPIRMPAHPMLCALLDAAPRTSPVVVIGARGRPFTEDGFRARFFKLIRDLQAAGKIAPGLTFHGLRTTTATMLAEAGCDTQTIMAITGHETEAMVAHYRRDADKTARAETAIAKLDFARAKVRN